MKRRFAAIAAGLAVVGFSTATARALDQITVMGEEKLVAGEITGISRTEITIEAGLRKEERKIPANAVVRIRYDDEPAGLNLARNAEGQGRFDAALEGYREALGEEPGEYLKAEIDFLIARTIAKMAEGDPTRQDEAIRQLTDFLSKHGESFHYYEALAQLGDVYLAKGDFANAESTFGKLEAAPFSDYKMLAGTSKARLYLKQNNVQQARTAFEAVSNMDAKTPAEKSQRFEAMLGLAICLQREGQHEAAVKELRAVTEQASATDTRLQAEAYVRLGDSYRQLPGHNKDAVLAYLHVDVLFASEKALHAESLFWLYKLWVAVGHPDRAAEAAAKLREQYEKSKWTAKLVSG